MTASTKDASGLLTNLLQQGFDTEKSLKLLLEFQTALSAFTQLQLRNFIRNVSLEPLFTWLKNSTSMTSNSSTDREKFSVIGLIMSKLFNCMEPDVVLNQFRDEILMGLNHSDDSIRLVCLKQVKRLSSKCQSEVQVLCCDVGLISSVVNRVGDDCLSVAQEASSTLDVICKTDTRALELLFSGTCLADMKRVASMGDIFRYRIFEVATKVSTHHSSTLMVVANAGILHDLISDLSTEDDLIQMSAIDMLTNLVSCKHGLVYMDQQGILSTMENMLITTEVQPILIPSLLKFFSSIVKLEPNQISLLPTSFFKLTLDLLGSRDTSLQVNAVEVISIIGTSVQGKEALSSQGVLMNEGLNQIGKIIQQPPMDVRIRSLMALENLFSLKNEEQTSLMLSILEQWFIQINNKPLQIILSICKQPFPELKCAALYLIGAIANQEWAQRLMNQHGGFHEYLLDRSTEYEQTGKHAKYYIIKTLAESVTVAEVFGRPFMLKLIEYVKDGPLFRIVQSEVALEEM